MGLSVSLTALRPVEVFDQNITHNLSRMATEANLYQALWRPEELGALYAKDLIVPLDKGLQELKNNPDKYKAFNPANGWGEYQNLVGFVEDYLKACILNPDALVYVSR